MDVLESEQQYQPQINFVREGLKIGLINGAIALLLMYGSYFAGLDTFVTVQFISVFIPYMIIILIIYGFQLRKRNGGYLSFKDGLQYTFMSYVIVTLLVAVGTYILYNCYFLKWVKPTDPRPCIGYSNHIISNIAGLYQVIPARLCKFCRCGIIGSLRLRRHSTQCPEQAECYSSISREIRRPVCSAKVQCQTGTIFCNKTSKVISCRAAGTKGRPENHE